MGNYRPSRFASESGYNQPTISRWLKPGGKPSLEFVSDVAEKFNVSLDWLVTGRGPKDPEEAAKQPGPTHARIREVAGDHLVGPADSPPVAREVQALYGPDAPASPDVIFDAQAGFIQRVRNMGREGKELAELHIALYKLKCRDPEKYAALLKLLDVEGEK